MNNIDSPFYNFDTSVADKRRKEKLAFAKAKAKRKKKKK